MKISAYIPVYSLTLLVSAALLFSIQPMFSKMILPLLGGTPQVWNTAMLFFQVMLLGGYAYAHGTTRFLPVRFQAILHVILLLAFTVALPIMIPPGWVPPVDKDPTLWQLSMMAVTVGGPFFVLAGSAPMFQRWFSVSGHKDASNPYFLYGASNLGSMSALLAYPVLIEPLLNVSDQAQDWMVGYFVLIGLTILCALMVWRKPGAAKLSAVTYEASKPITWKQRGLWIFLAFIPSSLMLGVTTFITTDIGAVPLLWIMPLALYVGTFIIVFARTPVITLKQSIFLQGVLLIILIAQKITFPIVDPRLLIGLHLFVFFFSTLTCHHELAKARPDAKHLTEFYLIMSFGGALGGFFNAIIAPQLLTIPIEYAVALIAACFVRYISDETKSLSAANSSVKAAWKSKGLDSLFNGPVLISAGVLFATGFSFIYPAQSLVFIGSIAVALCLSYVTERRWLFGVLVTCVFLFYPLGFHWSTHLYNKLIHQERNFFGVLKVADNSNGMRILLNGTTNHGAQALDEKNKLVPLSYYSKNSPISDLFQFMNTQSEPQKVGVIGLGVGVMACFEQKGRSFDFYEIDKTDVDIAENKDFFTFLSDCGSPYRIILGDGRLTLQKEQDKQYDLFAVDAFSSDNIPVHLLTLESIKLYLSKIKDDGILTIHVSNRYLDLEPVLQKAAEELGIPSYAKISFPKKIELTQIESYPSHWVVFSKNPKVTDYLTSHEWTETKSRDGVMLWTDQYSNIFRVLGNESASQRFDVIREQKKDLEKD